WPRPCSAADPFDPPPAMARKRPPLTPDVEQAIAAFIRAGGFPHVAAEAAGIPRSVFESWLRRGRNPQGPRKYRAFVRAIDQAAAQARLGAEAASLKARPL